MLVQLCPEIERTTLGAGDGSIRDSPNSVSMAQSVLLLGYSYVPRFVRFMRETNPDNFEFKAARYSGRMGVTIAKLVANGLFLRLEKHCSHVVFLDVGTNDLDKQGLFGHLILQTILSDMYQPVSIHSLLL